jgi:RNA polymerase sigma-70 factor, ECF subfamily
MRPSPRGASAVIPEPDSAAQGESSCVLVARAQAGDAAALEELCSRYLPRLRRWAHGRLPMWARSGALDTFDLVQDTFLQVLGRLDQFQPRHAGAFQGYMRRTLMNRIRDEIRRVGRRGGPAEAIDTSKPAADPSPLEEAIGQQTLERYEAGLERLRDADREAIIMRVEMGASDIEIMEAFDKPSVAAAHMAVSRALVRLAEEMSHETA